MAQDFTTSVLTEGVTLYVQPTRKFKTTSVYLYLHLPLAEQWVTYNALLPMVLARGSAEHPTTAALARHLDDLYGTSFGIDISRRGEVQSLVFSLEVTGEQHIPGGQGLLREALRTLSGIVTRPTLQENTFRQDYVSQEAANLRQMIEGLINDKRRWAMVRCTAAMCRDEAFSLYRLGRVDDLPAITPKSLLDHHANVMATAPVDLFVIGDIEPEAAKQMVLEALPELLGAGKQRRMPSTEVKREPGRPVQSITESLDVNQGVLVIGLRTGSTSSDEGYFPLLVANGVLGGFPHSKLFQEVRERNSLAYFAYSSVETLKGIGYMYAGIEFENREKCQEIMLEQLRKMQAGEITDEELETTIETLTNDMLGATDSPGAMADLALDRVFTGRDLTIEQRVAAYQRVTAEQVAEAARKFAVDTVYFLDKKEGGN